MKIIIDTNILMSALIKDSLTRNVILKFGSQFYYPSISLEEIKKYQSLILEKSQMDEFSFYFLLQSIISSINLLDYQVILPTLSKAKEIMDKIDEKDTIFIASALALGADGIWSEDNHFEKQNAIKLYKTQGIINILSAF